MWFLVQVHSTLHTENKQEKLWCELGWVGVGWTSTWVGGGGVDVNIGGWGWGGRQHGWVEVGWRWGGRLH